MEMKTPPQAKLFWFAGYRYYRVYYHINFNRNNSFFGGYRSRFTREREFSANSYIYTHINSNTHL